MIEEPEGIMTMFKTRILKPAIVLNIVLYDLWGAHGSVDG
jgi:hypothetical protein